MKSYSVATLASCAIHPFSIPRSAAAIDSYQEFNCDGFHEWHNLTRPICLIPRDAAALKAENSIVPFSYLMNCTIWYTPFA